MTQIAVLCHSTCHLELCKDTADRPRVSIITRGLVAFISVWPYLCKPTGKVIQSEPY